MRSDMVADRVGVLAAFAAFDAACQALTRLEFTAFTTAELLELQSRREHATRITARVDHRILATLQNQASAKEIGGKSWTDVLALRLRISRTDATARIKAAEHLGPRHTIGGDVLPPLLPLTAAALADGKLTVEHADIIRTTLRTAETYSSRPNAPSWSRRWCGSRYRIHPRPSTVPPPNCSTCSTKTATALISPRTPPGSGSAPKTPTG